MSVMVLIYCSVLVFYLGIIIPNVLRQMHRFAVIFSVPITLKRLWKSQRQIDIGRRWSSYSKQTNSTVPYVAAWIVILQMIADTLQCSVAAYIVILQTSADIVHWSVAAWVAIVEIALNVTSLLKNFFKLRRQLCTTLYLVFINRSCQGYWWGLNSWHFEVWPMFLFFNVISALEGTL